MSETKSKEVESITEDASDTVSSKSNIEANFLIYNRDTKEKLVIKKDWTEQEETQARRKMDFIILPLLFAAFFILQIDRGNISNALTDTLLTDIGIDTNDVNTGNALFNVGIVVFEIPSNIILQKVGPGRWLSFQVVAWSLIATLQSQIKNRSDFLATRFLMGAFESGFIPGALFYLSTWYTKSELTLRHTFYFYGNLGASACSGLIAYGILKDLPGRGGIAGWQWIFIVEGVLGIGFGIIFALLIPEATDKARPFWAPRKLQYLTERQQYILTQRIIIDDPLKLINSSHINVKDILLTFKQPRIWGHFFLSLIDMIDTQALSTYTPLIIRSLGYSTLEANARSSIPRWMALVILLMLTYTFSHFKPRTITMLVLLLWQAIFMVALRALPDDSRAVVKFAVLVVVLSPGASAHVLNTSWLSINCKTPQERSIALAMVVMAANIAGICGGQVLRENDRPYYHRGFLSLIVTNWVVVFWCLGLGAAYYYANRKLDAAGLRVDIEAAAKDADQLTDSKPNTVVVFVGKGHPEDDDDTEILSTLQEKDYSVQDKELELVQGVKNFRYSA